MNLPPWVKIPTQWIEGRGLHNFTWSSGGAGADHLSALILLMIIAHNAHPDTLVTRITYDRLMEVGDISREKVANGLAILDSMGIVEPLERSTYAIKNFDPDRGWAKLPARTLYNGNRIEAFKSFRLRTRSELDAMKLYFLFVARRGNDTNMANISFEKITEYSGVRGQRIKAATSLLAALSLAYIERVPSQSNEFGVAQAYRLVGLDSRIHMGTRGRKYELDI